MVFTKGALQNLCTKKYSHQFRLVDYRCLNPENTAICFMLCMSFCRILSMQSCRFSQYPAFISRTAKERDKKCIVISPQRYKM
jgi:hypothetical protein